MAKKNNLYGCDVCYKRFDQDNQITWITSSYGLCNDCYQNKSKKQLKQIRGKE
jgi:hypothetical protein